MRAEASDAFTKARQYDTVGRVAEAIALYERVVAFLPEDDPTRKIAKARLDVLKKEQR